MSLTPIVSPVDVATGCPWCGASLGSERQRFCSKRCRQSAFRLRRRAGVSDVSSDALFLPSSRSAATFAYADPPYLGVAAKYYAEHHPDAAAWDDPNTHRQLVASLLEEQQLAGFAVSASPGSLRTLLPMFPPGARVCGWGKPIGVSSQTYGAHNCWEAVIVVGGRPTRPGIRDWLYAMPARGGGSLPGRKPLAFCAWLFDLLGMRPGDELRDIFPGTGIVSTAWLELATYPRPRASSLPAATTETSFADPATRSPAAI